VQYLIQQFFNPINFESYADFTSLTTKKHGCVSSVYKTWQSYEITFSFRPIPRQIVWLEVLSPTFQATTLHVRPSNWWVVFRFVGLDKKLPPD